MALSEGWKHWWNIWRRSIHSLPYGREDMSHEYPMLQWSQLLGFMKDRRVHWSYNSLTMVAWGLWVLLVVMPRPGSAQVPGPILWPLGRPEPAPSQLSQQKNCKMGGVHFRCKYLVYYPHICIYKLSTRYIYNKYRKKTLYTICRWSMPHCLAIFTDGKLTKRCRWKSSPGFSWPGMVM